MSKNILQTYISKYLLVIFLFCFVFSSPLFADTSYGEGSYGSATYNTGDTTAPSGGYIAYLNGYVTVSSISLTVDDGSDTGFGLDISSRVVKRSTSILSNGNCAGFGSFTDVTDDLDGTYPSFTDTAIFTSHCYKYEYLVSDNAGNQAVYTTSNIVKVDTVKPEGDFYINDGDTSTSNRIVDLSLNASDSASNVVSMIVSENSSFIGSSWELYATNKSIVLSEGEGEKTIYVQFKDGAGNVSEVLNQSILFEEAEDISNTEEFKEITDTANKEEETDIPSEEESMENEDSSENENTDTEKKSTEEENEFPYLYVVGGITFVLLFLVLIKQRKKNSDV